MLAALQGEHSTVYGESCREIVCSEDRPTNKHCHHGQHPGKHAPASGFSHPVQNRHPLSCLIPDTVHNQTETVKSSPDYKMPGGTVPQSSQQHRDQQIAADPGLA